PGMHAQSPERHSAQFIGCVFRRILDNAIAGSNVMEQKIAEWVNDLVAKCLRYCERSAIDGSSRRSGDDGADVAGGATDRFKDLFARLGNGGCSESRVARWNLRASDELSEVVDIRQAKIVRCIFGVGSNFANRGDV